MERIRQLMRYDTKTRKNSNRLRVYDTNGLAPTLGGMGGGGRDPWILIDKSEVGREHKS